MSTIIVKPALSDSCKQAVAAIERQVFNDELGVVLSNDRPPADAATFQLFAAEYGRVRALLRREALQAATEEAYAAVCEIR